jgi:hypothetical protein
MLTYRIKTLSLIGITLLLTGCGGGGDSAVLDAGYLGLSGIYACKAQAPFESMPDRSLKFLAEEQAGTLTESVTKRLVRWAKDSNGLPLYTDAGSSAPTTVMSFKQDRTLMLVEGSLNDPINLNITPSYLGLCIKQ